MHFYKKTSIGKSNNYIKLIIKLILIFFLFIALLMMLDQINFPAPNKKIEKLIGRNISFYLASKFISDQEHIILFNSKEDDFNRQ